MDDKQLETMKNIHCDLIFSLFLSMLLSEFIETQYCKYIFAQYFLDKYNLLIHHVVDSWTTLNNVERLKPFNQVQQIKASHRTTFLLYPSCSWLTSAFTKISNKDVFVTFGPGKTEDSHVRE